MLNRRSVSAIARRAMQFYVLLFFALTCCAAGLVALDADAVVGLQLGMVVLIVLALRKLAHRNQVLGSLIALTYALLGAVLLGLYQFGISRLQLGPPG